MDQGVLDLDQRIRLAAFVFLTEQTQLHGEVLPYATLLTGFTFDGTRVPLVGPQGIFKPAILPEMLYPSPECTHRRTWAPRDGMI